MLINQPHHDGSLGYLPDPNPNLGQTFTARVLVPHDPDGDPSADAVAVRIVHDGEPQLIAAQRERSGPEGVWWSAELTARNPISTYRFFLTGGSTGYAWLNGTGLHRRDVSDAMDFRVTTYGGAPDWVVDQVAYQVFPDRFARGSDPPHDNPRDIPEWAEPAAWTDPVCASGPSTPRQLYGGDLDGVREHLDHVRDLGATVLYLTPFFPAHSNHRYDASSFDRVDPLLGGDPALARLIEAAHRAGIRVIGDLTTNHTGDGHEWFRAAQADPAAAQRSFYRFVNHPHEYEGWLGVSTLPRLDHRDHELARLLYDGPDSVAARWLRFGLDGWRIDVANMTGRSAEVDLAQHVARRLRATATAERSDAWLIAEHGHDAGGDLAGDGWHGTMDYAGFTRPVWTWLTGEGAPSGGLVHGLSFLGLDSVIPRLPARAAMATMREIHAGMPWHSMAASTTHLDSHDTPRFRTVTGGGVSGGIDRIGTGRDLHLLGVALQFTLPGVPTVFMGDEIGLTGINGEHSRTPFPWDADWDDATHRAYRWWIAVRHAQPALRRGGMRWVDVGDDHLTFLRELPQQRLLVHLGRSTHRQVLIPLRQLGITHVRHVEPITDTPVTAGPRGAYGPTMALPDDGPAAHLYQLG